MSSPSLVWVLYWAFLSPFIEVHACTISKTIVHCYIMTFLISKPKHYQTCCGYMGVSGSTTAVESLSRPQHWLPLQVSLNKFTIPMCTNHLTLGYYVDICTTSFGGRCCILQFVELNQEGKFICHFLSLNMCEFSPVIWMVRQWLIFPLNLRRGCVSKPVWETSHVVLPYKESAAGKPVVGSCILYQTTLKRIGFRGCQICSALSSSLESPRIYLIKVWEVNDISVFPLVIPTSPSWIAVINHLDQSLSSCHDLLLL